MYGNYVSYPYGGYGSNIYPPQQPQTQQMSFVNGIEGAKGFIVPPNTSAFLMDSDAERFYIKTADRNGMCNIKRYVYTEEIETPVVPQPDLTNYVTREEFDKVVAQLAAIVDNISATKKTLL